jgi:hypothetical protein
MTIGFDLDPIVHLIVHLIEEFAYRHQKDASNYESFLRAHRALDNPNRDLIGDEGQKCWVPENEDPVQTEDEASKEYKVRVIGKWRLRLNSLS